MVYFICAVLLIAVIVLTTAFICFYRVFFAEKRKPLGDNEYEIPDGEIYEVFRDEMIGWVKDARAMPHEEFTITSFDGLKLSGKYYECENGAPIELLFHGYQGDSERDLSGGIKRCFALGRNALLIDQRAHGRSEGSVITFGINECRDCLSWVNFAVNHFGGDVKLILTGVSMGAATVMMAAGEKLPRNVVCVLADCGYTTAEEIIKKVIREMRLPANILYPFVRLGAIIFGRFDPNSNSPLEAMQRCTTPVIFIHGDNDAFVPHEMSRRLYEACISKKKMVTIHGAGHGLAYPVDKEGYVQALRDFQIACGF